MTKQRTESRKPRTIAEVDKMARTYGYRFYKGNGYCYFTYDDVGVPALTEESVYVNSFRDLTMGQWARELIEKIHYEVGDFGRLV